MADEDHILRNAQGVQVGVTCTECGRILDAKEPTECADCRKEARRSAHHKSDDQPQDVAPTPASS